jgi:PncC family amidohydrolase
MHDPLFAVAPNLATGLRENGLKIVFAESCTAGLASATLAKIPGISEHHCGSAVVYRLDTKHQWLGVSNELLENPGPVSQEVAEAMATGVFRITPEADLAATITGHLGPNAPTGQDGLVWMAVARRMGELMTAKSVLLQSAGREVRQAEAARTLLEFAATAVIPAPATPA